MLLSYDDALKAIQDTVARQKAVQKPLLACAGHVAFEDIAAEFDMPQWPIASRDGYAVRSQDIQAACRKNPVVLRIMASARAGRPACRVLAPHTAIRIMTGAIIPQGADCVVQFEDTNEPADKNGPNRNKPAAVAIYAAMSPGDNIFPSGSNVRQGDVLLRKGTLMGPAHISALASMGQTRAMVVRQPTVAIISTGDELVRPGGRLSYGKIYNGNSAGIASLVSHYGGVPKILGIARDKETSLASQLEKARTADAIVTIGGVSKGDYDLVRIVLAKIGRIVFSGIRRMPEAAVTFSVVKRLSPGNTDGTVPVFSLVGHPTGCLINFETVVRPALLKMLGFTSLARPLVQAVAQDSARHKMPMDFVAFACLQATGSGYAVKLNLAKSHSAWASMTEANSLAIIGQGAGIRAGDVVQVMPLSWRLDQLFF